MQGNSGIKPLQIVVMIPVRNLNREEILQGGLRELSTPAKGEAENDDDAKEDGDGSVSQSLTRLYQKATRAGLRVAKAN
ncbi:hypothetical protein RhiirA4_461393 [Rhizophagus irregularis]|uniref:Uncharacterized protein n=1 Tax=Rhizophagus irregularis TaxID=588596 RepID=A0A2I1GIQ2_9GLOM|nr:hypothetical protein RhiirA4_461393 [Rhizophagus irregularis]